MKKIILAFIALSLLSFSVQAQTQNQGKKKTVYKKTQEVSFESTDVDGLVRSPDGAYLNQKKGVKFLPLYKIGNAFDREVKNSVEHLR